MNDIVKNIRHTAQSLICSLDDDVGANQRLLNMCLGAASLAIKESISLPEHAKNYSDARFANVYPGEHYRLLKGLSKLLNPSTVVEIGTSTGLGTLTLAQALPNSKIYTYDLFHWENFNTFLSNNYFASGNVIQCLSDLGVPEEFEKHKHILNQAQLIFIDGPKDDKFEYKFMKLLTTLDVLPGRTLFIDDIRVMNMIEFWRRIKSPKLDVTSFGHWSGTGVVDMSEGLIWQDA